MSSTPPPDETREPTFRTRIFIEPDGRVVIENLSEEMLELARALDPDATLACDAPQAGSGQPGASEESAAPAAAAADGEPSLTG